ncbi:MAG: DUF6152 family protein [Sphingomonadales bacterium]
MAAAHHSATQFDLQNPRPVTGIVKVAKFANPHAHLVLRVTDARGTRDWVFEGHSMNNYYRDGWRRGMIKAGDRITTNSGPLRDGSDGGYALGIEMANGMRVGRW